MSHFSGSYDFSDCIDILGEDRICSPNTKIYIDNIGPICNNKIDFLIPFYGHKVLSSYSTDIGRINLSKKPEIDYKEEHSLKELWGTAKKLVQKSNKEKVDFTLEYVINSTSSISQFSQIVIYIMGMRLITSPKDKSFEYISKDIYLPTATVYRVALCNQAARSINSIRHPLIQQTIVKVIRYILLCIEYNIKENITNEMLMLMFMWDMRWDRY